MLSHVTWPNGHLRISPQSEVQPEAIKALRLSVLPGLHAGRSVRAPGFEGWWLRLAIHSRAGGRLVHLRHGRSGPIVLRSGTAWSESAAEAIWPAVSGTVETGRAQWALPWCVDAFDPAALIELAAPQAAQAAVRTHNLTRCLAWAFLPDRDRE